MGVRIAVSCALSTCLVATSLRAAEPLRVLVRTSCAPEELAVAEVVDVLRAELAPDEVVWEKDTRAPARQGDSVIVLGACDGVHVRAEFVSASGEPAERIFDLADVPPETRARTLAMALSEAMRSRAPAGAPSPAPSPARIATTTISAEKAPPEGDSASARAFVQGILRLALDTTTPVVGIAGGARWSRFAAGVLLLGARDGVSAGAAQLLGGAVTASIDVLPFSVGAIFARGEIGAAVAWGAPSASASGHSGAALHGAGAAGVRVAVPLGRASLEASLDAGVASTAVAQINHRDAASLGKYFATAGIGMLFP